MSENTNKPTKEQLLKTIRKLKNNPNDKFAILGDIGIVGLGTGLGIASAGTLATAAGATAIPVLTTVGSWVGITLVGATPVGWVAGAAIAGGTAAFGVSRLIKNGSYMSGKNAELLKRCEEQLREVESKERASSLGENDKTKFIIFLEKPISDDLISPQDAHDLIIAVENGQIPLTEAYQLVQNLINSAK